MGEATSDFEYAGGSRGDDPDWEKRAFSADIRDGFGFFYYRRDDFKRAVLLSGIVGSWLVAFNQGSAILGRLFDEVLYLRIVLDYATPFAVSSVTSILRNRSDHRKMDSNSGRSPRAFNPDRTDCLS